MKIENYDGADKHLAALDYQKAIDSQSACNLSGIVRWFAGVTENLWQDARERKQGTDWVNEHPICRLMAEQIAFLAGGGSCNSSTYHDASAYCEKRAKEIGAVVS